MGESYCNICGNTGINPSDGSICSCRWDSDSFFSEASCLQIPQQYQGVGFNKTLVNKDTGEGYAKYLEDLYNSIVTMRLRYHNIVLCSPHQHSKTIMAYSCVERLFRASVKVAPVLDIMEIRNILNCVDIGKVPTYKIDEPENIVEAPYLFVRLPMYPSWDCFDTMNTLLSRRVRRGNSTIYLYSGTWSSLLYCDKGDFLRQLKGDGSYSTLEIKSFDVQNSAEE